MFAGQFALTDYLSYSLPGAVCQIAATIVFSCCLSHDVYSHAADKGSAINLPPLTRYYSLSNCQLKTLTNKYL